MVDYKNCTDSMFKRAMSMKNKAVDKIPSTSFHFQNFHCCFLNNPVPVSLLSGDRKPQIRFLGNHHSGSGNLYHKSFRM